MHKRCSIGGTAQLGYLLVDMKILPCLFILLIDIVALAQLPPYVRNPITTNGPSEMTNQVLRVARSGPFETPTRIIWLGDSITSGLGLTNNASFAYELTNRHRLNNVAWWTNAAYPGQTLQAITNRYLTEVYPHRPAGGTNAIVNLLVGANDWGNITDLPTAAAYAANLDAFYALMKADGFLVSACTPTVVGTHQLSDAYGFWEDAFDIVSARIRRSTNVDYLIDLQRIAPDGNNTNYYSSWGIIHPTELFHSLAADVIYREWNLGKRTRIPSPETGLDYRAIIGSKLHPRARGTNVLFYGYGTFANSLSLGKTNPAAAGLNLDIEVNGGYGANVNCFKIKHSPTAAYNTMEIQSNYSDASNPTSNQLLVRNASGLIFTVKQSGKVGVGVTNPAAKFEVAGESRMRSITATNGYFLPTNAISAWPTVARVAGEAFFGNSNGTVYLLTSVPGSTAWAATNKIAP